MLERIANSRTFLSFVLAGITGLFLFFFYPFPQGNLYLQYIALKDPLVYSVLARSYTLFLFTTPFFIYSTALSGVYVLSFRRKRKQKANSLPPYPNPSSRDDLFLVVGEIHHPTRISRGTDPQWLTVPEKGLYTGIGIFGAIGTGKTSCCMRPFAEQLIAYRAVQPAMRIGGLVLEVKGDFCHQIREIARQYGREDDYVEVALDSEYRYNPLHNDLDPSALASAKLDELLKKPEAPECQRITVEAPPDVDDIKRQQLEAVQRWYFDDWMGLERKLRSSIVEGVSIFLSLFDINPAVKRVFCPPKQTYDLALNKPNEHGVYPYGRPLPSFNWLIEQG